MAAGDLITIPNQFEYNGLLLGKKTIYQYDNVDGLLSPPAVLSRDLVRQDADGNFPGRDTYGPRYVTFDVNVDSVPATIIDDIRSATTALKVRHEAWDVLPFVFQLDDGDGKKFCWMRPRNSNFKLTYPVHTGYVKGAVQLIGHDPRYYSINETMAFVNVGIGATVGNLDITNLGNYDSGPIVEITGPATNPRITNPQDGGRTIKTNIVVPAGKVLSIDMRLRLMILDGASVPPGTIRNDSQWWRLQPGVNHLVMNRDDSAALAIFAVKYRDTWIS